MMNNHYKSQTGMHTDTYATGKLYDKLDAYMESQRPESKGVLIYMCSSNQFRTQRRFKAWLREHKSFGEHVKLVTKKEVK